MNERLQVIRKIPARECRTREEFDQYLRQELHYEPGSVKYETAMLAWAVFKRETEGF